MRTRVAMACLVAGLLGGGSSSVAARPVFAAALSYCRALAHAANAATPNGPVFIRSYEHGPGETDLPAPLKASAFAYDNALASIALTACGDVGEGARIADAFVVAARHDRTFRDGRIRNAYHAGAVTQDAVRLPGWWNMQAERWDEDAYQDSTATGNIAWVALAMLNTHAATGRRDYLDVARGLLAWIRSHAADAPGPEGYSGGMTGFDGNQHALTWKSTEHNIDVAAAARWASELSHDPDEAAMSAQAASFVATRFVPGEGYFLLGTNPEGRDAARGDLALDVQVWPILGVKDAPVAWRRALTFADRRLRHGDGMTFAGFGPNRWNEGTAQAALAFRSIGSDVIADKLLEGLAAHVSPSGLLYATSVGEVPTGLKVESENGGDFVYFHRPHLGATAWAALAALRYNPFTGRTVN